MKTVRSILFLGCSLLLFIGGVQSFSSPSRGSYRKTFEISDEKGSRSYLYTKSNVNSLSNSLIAVKADQSRIEDQPKSFLLTSIPQALVLLLPSVALAEDGVELTLPQQAIQWIFVAYVGFSLLAGFKELFVRAQRALQNRE